MVETEPTGCKENMAAKVSETDRAKTLNDALLRVVSSFENVHDLSKQQSAAIKSFAYGSGTFVSLPTGHGKSLIYRLAIPQKCCKNTLNSGFLYPSVRHN